VRVSRAEIVCDAPAGRIEGAAAYRESMSPFVRILKRAKLWASFGDDETAVLVYDTETVPVASAPGAECLTVRDVRIIRSRFIFDRKPFEDARAGAD
jgi:hypothetical protein